MGQKLLSGFSVPLLPKPLNAAKRYRVDVEKLQKAVAGELAAKLAKTGKDKSTVRSKEVA
jgi:hypothetical protein